MRGLAGPLRGGGPLRINTRTTVYTPFPRWDGEETLRLILCAQLTYRRW